MKFYIMHLIALGWLFLFFILIVVISSVLPREYIYNCSNILLIIGFLGMSIIYLVCRRKVKEMNRINEGIIYFGIVPIAMFVVTKLFIDILLD